MKKPTSKEINAAAKEVFDSPGNEGLESVHVTFDLQCFGNEHSAFNHQKHILGHSPETDELPVEVKRDEAGAEGSTPEGTGEKKATAADLIEKINAAETVEAVNEILGDDSRASVVKAANARIEALAKAVPPHSAGPDSDQQ